MKPFIKCDERTHGRMDAQTDIGHFIISHPGPIGRQEIIKLSLSKYITYFCCLSTTKPHIFCIRSGADAIGQYHFSSG